MATPWQPWAGRTILTANPDAGALDAAPMTQPITTPLYTSDDYYSVIHGGPVPPEPYIGEYGNIAGTAPATDGGVTDASSNTDAPIQ